MEFLRSKRISKSISSKICQGDALTNNGKSRFRSAGFSTIELLMAMAIGIIVMAGVVLVTFGNQSSIIGSATNADAIAIAQQTIEHAHALGRQDFNLVNSTTSSETRGGITYTKMTTVTLLSDYLTKQVTTVVSWAGEHGQSLSTSLTTYVTNLDNVNSPNMCNSAMTNVQGWKNPQDTSFDFQQLLYGNNSSGLSLSSIYVLYKKMYVVASSPPANKNDDSTFFVLDVTGSTPVYLGGVDNDADKNSSTGLNDVTVASTSNKIYAFVANNNDADFLSCSQGVKCSQMQVIDATNAAAPSVVYSLKLATSSAPYVYGNHPSAAGEAVGNAVFYSNGYLYVGLKSTTNGPAFHIIDVRNPLIPLWVGSWPSPTPGFGSSGASVDSILVKGKYAYVSHPDGLVGATNEELTVLDVSDPANPVRVSGFSNTVGPANAGGKGAMIVGSNLYFGRSASNAASSDSIPEFYILNDADPTSVPSTPLGTSALTVDEGINNLVIRDFLAFLLTTTEFKVIDISNPSSISTWGTLALPGHGGSSFDCDGDRFFVIHDVSKDFVSIVTPSQPFVYTLSTPVDVSVSISGGTQTTSFTATKSSGTGQPVTYSNSSLPPGVTMTYSTNPCTPTCTETLTVSAAPGATPGTYPITITGSPNGISTSFNVTINKATPSLTTTPSAGGVIGTTLSSAAALTGGAAPTGGLVFSLYSPSDVTCSAAPAYTVTDSTAPFAAPGIASTVAGVWHWTVSYAGDSNNNAVTNSCADATTITKATPAISAVIHNAAESVIASAPAGIVAHVRASVTGGSSPSGGVTFTFFSNSTCSGAGSSAGSAALSGGVAHPSSSQGPLNAGSYSFNATYAGDSNNNSVTSSCMPLAVTKITPTISMIIFNKATGLSTTAITLGQTVYDTANISVGAVPPTGNITFQIYINNGAANCTQGTPQSGGVIPVSAAGAAQSSDFKPTAKTGNNKFDFYVASYGGDINYNSVTAACEPLTVN